jgi:hypothetical protein
MSAAPLTHHEIIEIVAPFTRRGRQLDLAASDRANRRLVFKPVEHDAPAAMGGAVLREHLELANPRHGLWRLTRIVVALPRPEARNQKEPPEAGAELRIPEARVEAEGGDPGVLLDLILAVDLDSGFRTGDGYRIAFWHRVVGAEAAERRASSADLILTRAVGEAAGVVLTLAMPGVAGYPADLTLTPAHGTGLDLPEDFLAVQGWNWRPLEAKPEGWAGTLRIRGREPARSRLGEARMEQAMAHIARTLGEPPARFHERFAAARWGVVGRRLLPVLACLVMVLGFVAVSRLDLPQDSAVQLLIFNAPPLLMIGFFALREIPRIEMPPLPRAMRGRTWRRADAGAGEAVDLVGGMETS